MNTQPQQLAQDVQFELVVKEGKGRGKPHFGQPMRSPPSPFVEMTSTDLWRMAQVADNAARKSWADQRSPGPSPGPVFLHPNKYGPSAMSEQPHFADTPAFNEFDPGFDPTFEDAADMQS